jgi:hypothetical protein
MVRPFSTQRTPALTFSAALLLITVFSAGGAAPPIHTSRDWVDLPTKQAVVHRLELNSGFLGPKEDGWDQLARRRFSRLDCIFLPDGAMVYTRPALKDRSVKALAKWFADTYGTQKVFARGTSVKAGTNLRLFARGERILPKDVVKIKACRKRGNFIQVQLVVPVMEGYTTRMVESPYWPLLELPLGKLPPGVYALEVVWILERDTFMALTYRQRTAFAVSER